MRIPESGGSHDPMEDENESVRSSSYYDNIPGAPEDGGDSEPENGGGSGGSDSSGSAGGASPSDNQTRGAGVLRPGFGGGSESSGGGGSSSGSSGSSGGSDDGPRPPDDYGGGSSGSSGGSSGGSGSSSMPSGSGTSGGGTGSSGGSSGGLHGGLVGKDDSTSGDGGAGTPGEANTATPDRANIPGVPSNNDNTGSGSEADVRERIKERVAAQTPGASQEDVTVNYERPDDPRSVTPEEIREYSVEFSESFRRERAAERADTIESENPAVELAVTQSDEGEFQLERREKFGDFVGENLPGVERAAEQFARENDIGLPFADELQEGVSSGSDPSEAAPTAPTAGGPALLGLAGNQDVLEGFTDAYDDVDLSNLPKDVIETTETAAYLTGPVLADPEQDTATGRRASEMRERYAEFGAAAASVGGDAAEYAASNPEQAVGQGVFAAGSALAGAAAETAVFRGARRAASAVDVDTRDAGLREFWRDTRGQGDLPPGRDMDADSDVTEEVMVDPEADDVDIEQRAEEWVGERLQGPDETVRTGAPPRNRRTPGTDQETGELPPREEFPDEDAYRREVERYREREQSADTGSAADSRTGTAGETATGAATAAGAASRSAAGVGVESGWGAFAGAAGVDAAIAGTVARADEQASLASEVSGAFDVVASVDFADDVAADVTDTGTLGGTSEIGRSVSVSDTVTVTDTFGQGMDTSDDRKNRRRPRIPEFGGGGESEQDRDNPLFSVSSEVFDTGVVQSIDELGESGSGSDTDPVSGLGNLF